MVTRLRWRLTASRCACAPAVRRCTWRCQQTCPRRQLMPLGAPCKPPPLCFAACHARGPRHSRRRRVRALMRHAGLTRAMRRDTRRLAAAPERRPHAQHTLVGNPCMRRLTSATVWPPPCNARCVQGQLFLLQGRRLRDLCGGRRVVRAAGTMRLSGAHSCCMARRRLPGAGAPGGAPQL